MQGTQIEFKYQLAMNNIIANLLLSVWKDNEVSVSRDWSHYSRVPRIHRPDYYSYTKTVGCLDYLLEEGYCTQKLGYFDSAGSTLNRRSRIYPTAKLLELYPAVNFFQQQRELLIMKDKKKM